MSEPGTTDIKIVDSQERNRCDETPSVTMGSLRARVAVALVVIVATTIVAGAVNLVRFNSIKNQWNTRNAEHQELLTTLGEAAILHASQSSHISAYLRTLEPKSLVDFRHSSDRNAEIIRRISQLHPGPASAKLERSVQDIKNYRDEIIELARDSQADDAKAIVKSEEHLSRLSSHLDLINAIRLEATPVYEKDSRKLSSQWKSCTATLAVILTASLALVICLLLLTTRSASGKLKRLGQAMEKLERGKENPQLAWTGPSEFATLAQQFNKMADAVNERHQALLTKCEELQGHKRAIDEHALMAYATPDGVLTYVNDEYCSLTGHSREELLGSRHPLLDTASQTDETESTKRRIEAGMIWRGQHKGTAPNGQNYWLATTVVPFKDTSGKLLKYALVCTDMTAGKEYEKLLSEKARTLKDTNKRIEAANRMIEATSRNRGEFLAKMSDEMRAPLNNILGFADLLLDGDDEGDEKERREWLGIIRTGGKRILSIIDDISNLSKFDIGNLELDILQCCPNTLIEEVVDTFAERAKEKGIWIKTKYAGALPEAIATDPSKLRQLIGLIVDNAVKFTQSGGVEVSSGIIGTEDKQLLSISVRDTGVGIPSHKLASIFDPFSEGARSVRRTTDGTGLGLAISKLLAEAMGGLVTVISEEGKGSTFTIEIPFEAVDNTQLQKLDGRTRSAGSPQEADPKVEPTNPGQDSEDDPDIDAGLEELSSKVDRLIEAWRTENYSAMGDLVDWLKTESSAAQYAGQLRRPVEMLSYLLQSGPDGNLHLIGATIDEFASAVGKALDPSSKDESGPPSGKSDQA